MERITKLCDLSIDALSVVAYYLTGLDMCSLAISGDGRMLSRLSQSVTSMQYETSRSAQILPSIFGVFNNLHHLHLGGQLSKSEKAVEFTSLDLSLLPSNLKSLTLACYNDISRYDFFPDNDGFSRFRNLTSLSVSYCNRKEKFFAHLSSIPLLTKLHIEKKVFEYNDMAHMPHTLTDLHIRTTMPTQPGDYSLSQFVHCLVPYPPNLRKLWLEPNCCDDNKIIIIDLSQLPLSLTDISFGAFFFAIFTNDLLLNNNLTRFATYIEHNVLSDLLNKLPTCLEEIDIFAESIISDEEVDFSKFNHLHTLKVTALDCPFTIKDTLPPSITKLSPDFLGLMGLKKSSPLLSVLPTDSKASYWYIEDTSQNYDVPKLLPIRRLHAVDHICFRDFIHVRHLTITSIQNIERDNTLAELKSLEVFSFNGDHEWLLGTISVPLKTLEVENVELVASFQFDFNKIWAKSLCKLVIKSEMRVSYSFDDFMRTLPQTLIHLDLSIEPGLGLVSDDDFNTVTVFQ